MKTFLYIALFTPLIVLFQFYVMGAGHDTVTGTFGSTYNAAGGPNAALSIFIVSQVTVLLLMAKEQLMSWWIVCLLIVWAFITLMLTMAQAIIGFIIIMFLFVVGKNFLKLSFSSITPLIVLCPIVLLLFNIYFNVVAQRTKMQSYTKSPNSYSEYIDRTLKLNLGTETNKLNRTNIILLWWKQNTEQSNIFQILFGNGLGSVKNAGLTKGHIQMRFGETNIAYTALACLLWDVGLIGTCLYICIYISGFTLARKLAKQNLPKIHKVFMSSAQLACLFFILSIPYKLSIIGNQPFNFYSFFILGYICFWQKKIRAVNYSIQLA